MRNSSVGAARSVVEQNNGDFDIINEQFHEVSEKINIEVMRSSSDVRLQ